MMQALEGTPQDGRILPVVVLWGLILCGVLLLCLALFTKRNKDLPFIGDLDIRAFFSVAITFVVAIWASMFVSFYPTLFLMALAMTTALTTEKTKSAYSTNVLFSCGVVIVFYLFFGKLMNVQFPDYILG